MANEDDYDELTLQCFLVISQAFDELERERMNKRRQERR